MKRRDFIASSSIVTAGTIAGLTLYSCNPDAKSIREMRVPGPNDTINLGVIGLGMRAKQLLSEFLRIEGVRVIAVCDIDDQRINRAVSIIDSHYGEDGACVAYKDFRELIEREDIDGVIVATPDHWHGIMTVMAIMHGKDVYCETTPTQTIRISILQ